MNNLSVIIEDSSGEKMLWSNESTVSEAKHVAETLELELKVFEYVKTHIDESLVTLHDTLGPLVSEDMVREFIQEVLSQKTRSNLIHPSR